ncbi:prosaposin isoform X2 [Sardina pilchardus]|uniref:prosaposin isoform X2 n=1 Tax=Sardina pilchardus TaxID=27697 RepID=UPI002E11E554
MSTFFKLMIFICLQNGVPARVMDVENLKAEPEQLPTEAIDTCKTCTEMFNLLKDLVSDPGVQVKSDLQCKFCVYLIELLEGLLPKERTEEAIAHMLEQVCHIVPSAYRDQCVAFIELYSKKLIELLLSQSSPHTICTLVHLCKGAETATTGVHMSGYACAMNSYRCQNLLTAMECGSVEYCQKYAWL